MKYLVMTIAVFALAACGTLEDKIQDTAALICTEDDNSTARIASRNAAAHYGLYVKCIKPESRWDDYELTRK